MGEMWMALWVFTFIGLFIIAVAVYDYVDRKKRSQEMKKWKYALALIIGLALMFPVVSTFLFYILPRLIYRKLA